MREELLGVLRSAVEDPLVPGAAATVALAGEQINIATPHADHPNLLPEELASRPFRIASVTKSFVAAALFRLSEQGRLYLHNPIAAALSSKTRAQLLSAGYDLEQITIRQLLTHTSGIRDHLSDPYQAAVLNDPQKKWTPADQIAFSAELGGPLFEPGRGFSYADTGYVLLGEIVELTTENSLAESVRSLLRFDDLKLNYTWWESIEEPRTDPSSLRSQYLGKTNGRDWDPSFDLFGGGGIISTTHDLCVFMRGLVRGHFFSQPATLAAGLWVPEVARTDEDFLHSGLAMFMPLGPLAGWGHSGFWGCAVAHAPDLDLTIALTIDQSTPQTKGLLRETMARMGAVAASQVMKGLDS